jgi:hypothetical protein
MLELYVLNDHGEPVQEPDHMKWAQWLEQAKRLVAVTKIGCYTISTVFLGADHNFGCGRPLLWETCVFGGEHDGEMERYSTLDDAKKGHDAMVGKLTREQLPRVPYRERRIVDDFETIRKHMGEIAKRK